MTPDKFSFQDNHLRATPREMQRS
ncbi:protein of unknown function [Nitratireductor aquimarinus]